MDTALITFERATCRYGSRAALADIDLTIHAGAFVGVVGPSGSGKTTLLRAAMGLVVPAAGRVRRARELTIAYVPQVEKVDWHFPITVFEAVLMARARGRLLPWASASERKQISGLLDRLGLGGLAGRHILELSGGQQQRVFIARALMRRPQLLVLDEPAAGVDARTRHELLHLLAELNGDGLTIVLTTHDLNGVATHLPELVCLNRRVVAAGPPFEVIRPHVLEQTYGAPMEVLEHSGVVMVVEAFRTPLATVARAA
jgi:ABC-type Mn2+/Zn2+ transport system ATPase subunit